MSLTNNSISLPMPKYFTIIHFNQADGFAQQRHQSKTKFIKLGVDVKKIMGKGLKRESQWTVKAILP
jgi:hypothetical protein